MRMVASIDPIKGSCEEEPWFFSEILNRDDIHIECRRLLTLSELNEKVKNGFDLNQQDFEGNTFIHFLVYEHKEYTGGWLGIRLLIDAGARLDIKNCEGLTAVECFEKMRSSGRIFGLSSEIKVWENTLYRKYEKQDKYD